MIKKTAKTDKGFKKVTSKKGWKKVESQAAGIKWDEPGKTVEGILIGMKNEVGKAMGIGKNKKKSTLYMFEGAAGPFGVWETANLASQLPSIEIGTEVRIVYKGIVKTDAGFKCKTFDVYVK